MSLGSGVPLFNGLKHLPCPREAGGAPCSTPRCLFGHASDARPSNSSNAARSYALDGATARGSSEDPSEHPGHDQKRRRLNPTSHSQQQVTNSNGAPLFTKKVKDSDLYDPLSPPTVGDMANEPPEAVASSLLRTVSTPQTTSKISQLRSPPQIKPARPHNLAVSPVTTPGFASSLNPKNLKRTNKPTQPSAAAKPVAPRSLAPSLAHSSPVSKVASPQANGECGSQNKAAIPRPQRKPETLNPRHVTAAPALHGTRYQLLKLLHIELVRLNGLVSARSAKDFALKPLIMSDQELIWMALDIEEKHATEKALIYKNKMSHTVVAHKRMDLPAYIATIKKQPAKSLVQHGVAGDAGGAKGTPKKTVNPIVIETGLSASQEVELLERLITPITNLEQYGYVSTPPTLEQIRQKDETVRWSMNRETCARCAVSFQVFPDRNMDTGELASGGTCLHHPGKRYFPPGSKIGKHRCCHEDIGDTTGCATADCHVWKTSDSERLANLWNWVETPANDSPDVNKAVAFDCEMGYTVHGMELLRLTATSWPDGKELVDVLVQPFGQILDPNSRWSGVFMEDLANADPWTKDWVAPTQKPDQRKILSKAESPQAARDLLFSVISPDTVLIGHGLENDLNAMRIIHPRIIDTILLYPHDRGLPVRNSLKVLMERHLRRQIQNDTTNGHDSTEDARAAGDLVRLQVQKKWETMLTKGWRFLGGTLRMPGWTATDV